MDPHRSSKRGGFTLLELLLVLGVLLAIASMAAPIIQRSFSYQQLRGAADQVRASFSRARAQSIRTGNVYAFLYTEGSDTYTLSPFINSYSLINPQVTAAVSKPPALDHLPRGLIFAGSAVSDDARAQFESADAVTSNSGMLPILFYPDGTSQEAKLLLRNKQGDMIRIDLRGLTGLSNTARVDDTGT